MPESENILTNNCQFQQIEDIVSKAGKKEKAHLINKLNYLNFSDRSLIVILKHKRFNQPFLLNASVDSCGLEEFDCLWLDTIAKEIELNKFHFSHLTITDNKKIIIAFPEVIKINNKRILFKTPENCYQFSTSNDYSFKCENIYVSFYQNSSMFNGRLLSFSPYIFEVNIKFNPPQAPQWVDPDKQVTVILHNNNEICYSNECKIINTQKNNSTLDRIYKITPAKKQTPRFSVKEFRNIRQKLKPSPDIIFNHPITKNKMILKVKDISGTGFSVHEDLKNAQITPGLTINNIVISLANSINLKCNAQVVYCNEIKNGKVDRQKCGMALLDISMEDHLKLLSILQQALDENSYICNTVNIEELWNFFFETGFIYPEKYNYIQTNKEALKETYKKLYAQNPHIARYFVYQDNGEILAHMSMLRLYPNSWLIHHHAANNSRSQLAGIKVLSQISRFANNVHNLSSAHMRYVFCYFRPENKFPERVFGGVARYLNDPRKCSLDTFAYLHIDEASYGQKELPKPWNLDKCSKTDLLELNYFYNEFSNGLIIDSFEIHKDSNLNEELNNEYNKLGFTKENYFFSLKYKDELKAIYLLNKSDIGLNMSDLTNCLKIFVIDNKYLNKKIFISSMSRIFSLFKFKSIPVLVYPEDSTKYIEMSEEKRYTLWILDLDYIDGYLKFCNRLLRKI